MGMLDKNLKLSIAQAVTSTGDTASTNVYDTGDAIGGDGALTDNTMVQVLVNTTVTSGGAATVQAVLQDSADNSTFADIGVGPVTALATLKAGAVIYQTPFPLNMRRYFRVAYRVGTAALTAGKFDAYVSVDVQRNNARASGFSVF